MPTTAFLACDPTAIKSVLVEQIDRAQSWLFEAAAAGASARQLEQLTWCAVMVLGATLLAAAFAMRCRRSMQDDVHKRGLAESDALVRMDADYHATVTTTFGPVTFPLFAYRDRSAAGGPVITRTPARNEVFPLLARCRSSEVLVEWETRLGSEMPFRRAQQALTFFTHGAVTMEDTTLARHMVAVGELVGPSWQYRRVQEIRAILRDRAVRDADTRRPIVYASTDAHALRRYVGETWEASWKMANGVRLWCVDKNDGHIVHLGGEYTWGDCVEVEALFRRLQEQGVLPATGDYGDGVHAQIAIVTDGVPWIQDRVLPLFPGAVGILDAWHLMERLGKEAAALFGEGTKDAREWYDDAVKAMLGDRPTPVARKATKRRGHKKRQPGALRPPPSVPPSTHDSARELAALVYDTWPDPNDKARTAAYETFLAFFQANEGRIGYADLRRRGYQIGSGAMEALHRVASQARLKLPGARWLERTSRSIFALRMLALVDRWDEFWEQPDLAARLSTSLSLGVAA